MTPSNTKDKIRFYEWLAVPIFVMVSTCCLAIPINFHHFDVDEYHHLAVVRELMAHPFSPGNPHVVSQEPSRYFSPHLWILCVLGRLLDLAPEIVLGLAGTIATGLYLIAIYFIGLRLHPSKFAPLLFLLFCSFAWGAGTITYVGFYNLSSLPHSATYPASFSFALALLGYLLFLKVLEQNALPLWKIPCLIVFVAVLALSHPLTGLFGLGLIGCVIAFGPASSFLLRVKLLALWACGVGLATLWPLYSYVDLFLLSANDSNWEAGWFEGKPFWFGFFLLGSACIGFLSIPAYLRSREHRHIAIALLVLLAGFFYGWSTEHAIAHRLIPFIGIFLHMGMTTVVLETYPAYRRMAPIEQKTIKALVLTIALYLLLVPLFSILKKFELTNAPPYVLSGEESLPVNYLDLAKCLARSVADKDAVAIADEAIIFPVQAVGIKAASMPRPLPFVHDLKERQTAEAVFFAPESTPEERREAARKYGATIAVYSRETDPEVAAKIDALGPKEIFYRYLFMVRLNADREYRPQVTFWSETCKKIPLDAHRDENFEWK